MFHYIYFSNFFLLFCNYFLADLWIFNVDSTPIICNKILYISELSFTKAHSHMMGKKYSMRPLCWICYEISQRTSPIVANLQQNLHQIHTLLMDFFVCVAYFKKRCVTIPDVHGTLFTCSHSGFYHRKEMLRICDRDLCEFLPQSLILCSRFHRGSRFNGANPRPVCCFHAETAQSL